jgi:hypothetical protein
METAISQRRAVQQTVRLIYPLAVTDVQSCIRTLTSCRVEERPIWEEARPHIKYLEETLPTTPQFLFGAQRTEVLEGYLQVRRDLAQRWFGNIIVVDFEDYAESPVSVHAVTHETALARTRLIADASRIQHGNRIIYHPLCVGCFEPFLLSESACV